MRRVLTIWLYTLTVLTVQSQSKNLDDILSELLTGSVPILKSDEAKEIIESGKNITLFDTRSKKEFEVSALKNAQFINYESFDSKQLNLPSKQDTIIFYCTVGYRSEQIGAKFKELGYSNIFNLYGGILDWVNAGYSVYKTNEIQTDSVHTYNEEWSQWLHKGVKVYD